MHWRLTFPKLSSGTNRQVNYLIDEAEVVGKGADVVISMLDHFLKNHWEPRAVLLLHADNCTGQNKNNLVIQFCMWLILVYIEN